MENREKFSSRLGFILISAGCAIGLGNVYRFPITTGAYGGAFFVLIYIAFLVLLGIPVMTAELAVGRASQRSIASSYDVLEKKGQKWHLAKYLGIAGNYLLMMFYTTISGFPESLPDAEPNAFKSSCKISCGDTPRRVITAVAALEPSFIMAISRCSVPT